MKGKTYVMQNFVGQCVDTFCVLGKVLHSSLKKAVTPFADESTDPKARETLLVKDCDNEDDSPHRKEALEHLGEEIRLRNKQLAEVKAVLDAKTVGPDESSPSQSGNSAPASNDKPPTNGVSPVQKTLKRVSRAQKRRHNPYLPLQQGAPGSSLLLH